MDRPTKRTEPIFYSSHSTCMRNLCDFVSFWDFAAIIGQQEFVWTSIGTQERHPAIQQQQLSFSFSLQFKLPRTSSTRSCRGWIGTTRFGPLHLILRGVCVFHLVAAVLVAVCHFVPLSTCGYDKCWNGRNLFTTIYYYYFISRSAFTTNGQLLSTGTAA